MSRLDSRFPTDVIIKGDVNGVNGVNGSTKKVNGDSKTMPGFELKQVPLTQVSFHHPGHNN